ncbi:MAG: DUF2914 domain-containing protein [Minisyncoccia bacterium]
MKRLWKKTLAWVSKNEGHISTVVFLTGFITDNLVLRRVDVPWVNTVFLGYLTIAAVAILITHKVAAKRGDLFAASGNRSLATFLPLIAQFCLGSLLSGCIIFYTRSANLYTSWPFILLLATVFIGNEVLRKYRERLVFQTVLFFFTLYSYTIFALPIAQGSMGGLVFFESGILSTLLFLVFLFLLRVVDEKRLMPSLKRILSVSGGILLIVNLFYFTGILPPLPLSLKDVGVYHSVAHATGGGYEVQTEKGSWHIFTPETIHLTFGDPVYVYSAVFAPITISIPIVHEWEWYDVAAGAWQTRSKVTFPISGGRDGGYRGYSVMTNPLPGLWRVSIETPYGAIIGRIRFEVEQVDTLPVLSTEIK